MLDDSVFLPLTQFDHELFRIFVPRGHHLRKALAVIPWDRFREVLAPYYSPDLGRPAVPPVVMLKLEYLRYHYHLSDRQVIERAGSDMAFRYFLQLNARYPLPDPSSLCQFRGRLGQDGFRKVFRQVIRFAREQGLVKDRLRLKDASHVIAKIAIPTTLALVAQARDKLLSAAEPFEPVMVEGERVNIELLREANASRNAEERLVARIVHLREILAWADAMVPPGDAPGNPQWQSLLRQRQIAHKILADQEDPKAGDKIRSVVDPELRRSKHGGWFDGYLLDATIDPDSELLTELNTLPANGDEAGDTVELVRQEEMAHGNDIQAISIDGVGFNGPVLRQLEDPEDLAINVFTPPPKPRETEIFTPDDFTEDEQHAVVTCPAGKTSRYKEPDSRKRSWTYRFTRKTCETCPIQGRCMSHPPKGVFGKTVRKSDYEVEYRRARQKASTPEYAAVRREHSKVERKLGELMNRYGGRHTRYRGKWKTLIHELMAATAMNLSRLITLRRGLGTVAASGQ
jgi:transposase